MIGTVELFLLRCRQELSWWERTKMVKGFMNYVNRWDLQEKIDIAIHVMFRERTCSTESELRMSKIWSDLCIFIGSYPWSTAEQKHRLRHHHHSISLCILKKNSMVLRSAKDQRIRQIEMSQNISNILCWIL